METKKQSILDSWMCTEQGPDMEEVLPHTKKCRLPKERWHFRYYYYWLILDKTVHMKLTQII